MKWWNWAYENMMKWWNDEMMKWWNFRNATFQHFNFYEVWWNDEMMKWWNFYIATIHIHANIAADSIQEPATASGGAGRGSSDLPENTRDPITTHSRLVFSHIGRMFWVCPVVRQCLYYSEIISLYSESPSMQDLDAVFWDHRTQCISFVSLHASVHILGVKMLKYIVVV